jgi:hypothetical protein
VALVDATGSLPAPAAVRWAPRYALGLPDEVTLYRRGHAPRDPDVIDLARGVDVDGLVHAAYAMVLPGRGDRLRVDPAVGVVVEGGAVVRFARPVLWAQVVGHATAQGSVEVIALHDPEVVDRSRTAAQATPGSLLPPLAADLIDAVEIRADVSFWLERLRVLPLAVEAPQRWQELATIRLNEWPSPVDGESGERPPAADSDGDVDARLGAALDRAGLTGARRVWAGLFASGAAHPEGGRPMAERRLPLGTAAVVDAPTVDVPALAFTLLAAVDPDAARDVGLLLDVTEPGADVESAWDYLVVGHWQPRQPLAGAARARVDLAAADNPRLLPLLPLGEVLLASAGPVPLPGAGGPDPGLALGAEAVWVRLATPAQAVEVEVARGDVEIAALAGDRVVDWATGSGPGTVTVCAEQIDGLALWGPGALLVALLLADEDPALGASPAAAVGDIGWWMFAARGRPRPDPPDPVTAVALGDPVALVTTPGMVRVGVRWGARWPVGLLWHGPAAYRVDRGPDLATLTTPVAGHDQPLVVPLPPATSKPAGDRIGTQGPHAVDLVADGETVVYGVRALDLFGRSSDPAASTPLTVIDTVPPAPPTAVTATVRADLAIDVTWQWAASDARVLGFRVHHRPGTFAREWRDGAVTAVASSGGRIACDTSIPVAAVSDLAALAGSVARIGTDRYLVAAATAGTGGLALSLHPNPSTPTILPTVGEPVRVFLPAATPGTLGDPAAYSASVQVTGPAARSATVTVTWPGFDAQGLAQVAVGVSSYTASADSPVAGPAVATRVQAAPPAPPRPATADLADRFASPPDPADRARYRVEAAATPGVGYHVYRALDETLLVVDAAQRNANRSRGGAPANPAPLDAADFAAVTAAPPGPAARLTNRALTALANLTGNEAAFEQLTDRPLVATSATLTFTDATLPGTGVNRYLYRLRPVAPSGALGPFGWVYPPVRLWPPPPARPTITQVTVDGPLARVAWSPEPGVARWRVHVTADETAARDERSMALLAEPTSDDLGLGATSDGAAGTDGAAAVQPAVSVRLPEGTRWWFRVVAVAVHPAPVRTVVSPPSPAVAAVPVTVLPTPPPALDEVTMERDQTADGGETVTLAFPADRNPTVRYRLLRRFARVATPPAPVGTWTRPTWASQPTPELLDPPPATTTTPALPTVTLVDATPAPAATPVEYLVVTWNESGRTATSAPIPSGGP